MTKVFVVVAEKDLFRNTLPDGSKLKKKLKDTGVKRIARVVKGKPKIRGYLIDKSNKVAWELFTEKMYASNAYIGIKESRHTFSYRRYGLLDSKTGEFHEWNEEEITKSSFIPGPYASELENYDTILYISSKIINLNELYEHEKAKGIINKILDRKTKEGEDTAYFEPWENKKKDKQMWLNIINSAR